MDSQAPEPGTALRHVQVVERDHHQEPDTAAADNGQLRTASAHHRPTCGGASLTRIARGSSTAVDVSKLEFWVPVQARSVRRLKRSNVRRII